MQVRRIIDDGHIRAEQRGSDGQWKPSAFWADHTDAFAPQWELARLRHGDGHHAQEPVALMPFQPLSFRDFMLYEQHTIDASRGLVRRFHRGQYRAARSIEVLTRRPFPAFRPHKLWDAQPIYYFGNHLTFCPSGTPITPPRYSQALDYELELGFVLDRPLIDATVEEAVDAIGAFVLVNDFSARDVQRSEMASGFGPQKSKHFASSMATVAVTADEILPVLDDLSGSVAINGRQVSTVSSRGMRWSLGEVLAHASRSEQLWPGELFATGTLPGGSGMETGNWLSSGDTLTLTLDRVGTIEHTIL